MNVGTLFRGRGLKMVFGGDCIVRVAGEVVFVPGLLPGEDFIGEVKSVRKDYARAVVKELLTRSPERVEPSCPGAGHCPGCVYMHCSHSAELRWKLEQLRDFLKPLGVLPEAVQCFGSEDFPAEFYRNKLKLQMRKAGGLPQLGYVFTDGRMYPVTSCRLASQAINEKLSALLADPGFISSMHDRMTITFRESADGVIYFRNSPGKNAPLLRETVLGKDFFVPPDGFFQVNRHGLEALVKLLETVLKQKAYPAVIDAYAGAGLFGAAAAACGVTRLMGVELEPEAENAVRKNWRNFGAQTVDFRTGDAAELLSELLHDSPAGALAVFDPPRGGLDRQSVRALTASSVQDAVYVSCHPATLVRDLGMLKKSGFQIELVRLIDMFPRSAHFETFVQLTRQTT